MTKIYIIDYADCSGVHDCVVFSSRKRAIADAKATFKTDFGSVSYEDYKTSMTIENETGILATIQTKQVH